MSTPTTRCLTTSWRSSGDDALNGIEIRPLDAGEHLAAELDLTRRAFGPISASALPARTEAARRSAEGGRLLGAFDGPRLVGSALVHPMRQWWHGRPLPMAGVGGVKVAPEERGRGVGRQLMTRLLTDLADQGYLVSALYPATSPLYRSLGWEVAGGQYETCLPAPALAALIPPDAQVPGAPGTEQAGDPPLRRVGPADAELVVERLDGIYQSLRQHGPATHEPGTVAAWLDSDDNFAYLAPDGFVSYRWADGHHTIRADLLIAASAATARALWRVIASHASIADQVRAAVAPDDPVSWLVREPVAETRKRDGWMLRVVDAPGAVAARGFPAAVSLSARLDLADPALPANSGSWQLEVGDGTGKLTPAQAGPSGPVLRLGPRGFAGLFAGVTVATLRRAGLVGGDSRLDDALDGAFGGQAAYMLHGF